MMGAPTRHNPGMRASKHTKRGWLGGHLALALHARHTPEAADARRVAPKGQTICERTVPGARAGSVVCLDHPRR
jgi:hypothetical protein